MLSLRHFWPVVFLLLAADSNSREERLWQFRNLGKAFYENPTTQIQAVEEFKKALDLAPDSAREQVNYGLALLRAGRTKEAVERLESVQKRFPELPHTWFNLGIVYKKDGDSERALQQFEQMVKLAPREPVSRYNLGVLYRQSQRWDDAIAQFQTAVALNHTLAAPHFQLYNVYRAQRKAEAAAAELKQFQELKKAQEGSATPEDMEWSDFAEIYDPLDAVPETLAPPVYDRRPAPGFTNAVALHNGYLLYSNKAVARLSAGRLLPVAGITDAKEIRHIEAGDFNNDGLTDLVVVTAAQATWYRGTPAGSFVRVNSRAGGYRSAVWLDYDHDYDLDLLLLGESSVLLRNQGAAGFVERNDLPLVKGAALGGVSTRVVADTKAFDLLVTYADRPAVMYRDRLAGKYEAETIDTIPAGTWPVRVADVNRDSFLDVVAGTAWWANQQGRGFVKSADAAPTADFFLDNGVLALPRTPANWLRVQLTGVKNLKLAPGAEVEVKAGALYQKKVYAGAPLTFDLGSRKVADTVRITWPNGLIQNETKQAAGRAYVYREAQRLSGSCPLIWTWNGKEFQFITDVLGVAPLGASSGDGTTFPIDHDEYVQIPGEALQAVDGHYEIRVTEELSEVAYLDQLHLYALDHPAGEEIVTNERWKSPPFPQLRLYGVKQRRYPVRAVDDAGADQLPRVTQLDRWYPDTFRRNDSGVAELHALTLDFGSAAAPRNEAILVLHGWVDWADGSTFLSAAQESKAGLIPPYLQVKNSRGEWQTVIQDMGMPDGKPKTLAVDLTGKFLSASREVRIVTNLCVYWDEIYLSNSNAAPRVTQTRVPTAAAEVRFRGFSESKIHPERKQPEMFFYAKSSPLSYWNPTPGRYTRYGDVLPLLEGVDDRYIVMGSGDEVRLQFNARALPPLPAGWRRDFLLKVDGWAKDRDANTAFSQSVEPLPFHGMSRYPYPAAETYPDDEAHREFVRQYLTRPALRLIRPLVAER
jgi:tetratricopeptide (TPR) repeat protein